MVGRSFCLVAERIKCFKKKPSIIVKGIETHTFGGPIADVRMCRSGPHCGAQESSPPLLPAVPPHRWPVGRPLCEASHSGAWPPFGFWAPNALVPGLEGLGGEDGSRPRGRPGFGVVGDKVLSQALPGVTWLRLLGCIFLPWGLSCSLRLSSLLWWWWGEH